MLFVGSFNCFPALVKIGIGNEKIVFVALILWLFFTYRVSTENNTITLVPRSQDSSNSISIAKIPASSLTPPPPIFKVSTAIPSPIFKVPAITIPSPVSVKTPVSVSVVSTVGQLVFDSNNAEIVGGDYQPIILINNVKSVDPTWNQLITFIKKDKTDEHSYASNSFVCADFAEMLHNNSEKEGIRSGYTVLDISSSSGGHALNCFQTTDKGLIYIDCTMDDGVVNLQVGKEYQTKSLKDNYVANWNFIVTGIHSQW